MEYTTTFELLVGERATAIDDLIVEDAREFAASIDATKWWFERLHTTTGSILNLTFRTTNNIEESIPFLLSQLDRATLRACSKATRGKFSYVPLPDILIPEPSQSAIVGARKAENRIEEWLGEQVAHRIVYEAVLALLSKMAVTVIEHERDSAPDLRKDGLPFILLSILRLFYAEHEINDATERYCEEWTTRVGTDSVFVEQIKHVAIQKISANSVNKCIERFVIQTQTADVVSNSLSAIKNLLSEESVVSNFKDIDFATKLMIEAATNMLGLPFVELIYVSTLGSKYSQSKWRTS